MTDSKITQGVRVSGNFCRKGLSVDLPVHKADFLDALGLINVNEEFLWKILHDRRNFLPQRFHSQKRFTTKIGIQRSGTFPSHGSSGAPRPSKINNTEESTSTNEETNLDDAHDREERDGDSDITFTPVLLPRLKEQSENPEAIRRFRDIRQKIKHLIQTDQKERQRIVMDGVLDKIPNDQRVSKEKKEEIMKRWGECVINKDYCSSRRSEENYGCRRRHFKRTSCLDNSMDRYCQLFYASFKTEAKQHMFERMNVREKEDAGSQAEREKRLLGRILCLPDLKSYSYVSEYSSPGAISSEAPNEADLTGDFSRGSTSDRTNYLDSQNRLQLDAHLEGDHIEEEPAENTSESAAVENPHLANGSSPAAKYSDGAPVSMFDVNYQEISPYNEAISTSEGLVLLISYVEKDESHLASNSERALGTELRTSAVMFMARQKIHPLTEHSSFY